MIINKEQAGKILEYLERQESILGHDNEAYRLHSGANYVLKNLGITKAVLREAAEANGLFGFAEADCQNYRCRKDQELLRQEIKRLRSKYEERCWCSVNVPAICGHKRAL